MHKVMLLYNAFKDTVTADNKIFKVPEILGDIAIPLMPKSWLGSLETVIDIPIPLIPMSKVTSPPEVGS